MKNYELINELKNKPIYQRDEDKTPVTYMMPIIVMYVPITDLPDSMYGQSLHNNGLFGGKTHYQINYQMMDKNNPYITKTADGEYVSTLFEELGKTYAIRQAVPAEQKEAHRQEV